MTKKYDYLIVGTIFAYEANKRGKKCLLIDKRNHIGGNIYTKEIEEIDAHKYGAHIFHTSIRKVWDYVNNFAEFNRYTNSPVAYYKGEIYNLPFNMNTFNKLWGVKTPAKAKNMIQKQVVESNIEEPKSLEEQAIKLVGKSIYQKLIKGYTEKQWGTKVTELPAFIIKRIPVRFTYDNNNFNDMYLGIPIGGYTKIIEKMLKGIEVRLNTDFFKNKVELVGLADKIVFTGMIDQFYDYKFGTLEYRSLRFEHEVLDEENHQGNAVVNYTEYKVPYIRIIEHKHFEYGTQPITVITKEYPDTRNKGDELYYPINNDRNTEVYSKYKGLTDRKKMVIFGGRLSEYKYYDMHDVIDQALKSLKKELQNE